MKKLLLLLLAFAPLLFAAPAHAQLNSTPPGCPYISSASCSIPVYPAGSPYALNQLVTGSDGNIYRSVVSANVADPASATECGVNWLPVMIFASKTVNINAAGSAQCTTVTTAMAFLQATTIINAARVKLQLADGTYSMGTTVTYLNHPFGGQIDLIGNQATPANVILNFTGVPGAASVHFNRAMFEILSGTGDTPSNGIAANSFGQIDGFTFNGPGGATGNSGYTNSMLLGVEGAGENVKLGPNVVGASGYACANARFGAIVNATGVHCSGTGDGAFWAYGNGSIVYAYQAWAHDCYSPFVASGSGILADNGGQVFDDGAFVWSCNNGAGLYTAGKVRQNGSSFGAATYGHDNNGVSHGNTQNDIFFWDTDLRNLEGVGNYFSANSTGISVTNFAVNSAPNFVDVAGNIQNYCGISNGNFTNCVIQNNGNVAYLGMNKNTQKAFGSSLNSGVNIAPMMTIGSSSNIPTGFGAHGFLDMYLDTDQKLKFPGSVTGTISLFPQVNSGTYEWDWPTSAGTSGYFLTSAGGAGIAMTWTANTFAPLASPTFTGTLTAPTINVSGLTVSLPVCTDASKNLTSTCPAGDLPILIGTTGSIGGGVLIAGACTSGTVAVANSTTAMAVQATPVTYPGDGVTWAGYVSTAGTVTVKVCAIVGLTPGASNYNVRVIQ